MLLATLPNPTSDLLKLLLYAKLPSPSDVFIVAAVIVFVVPPTVIETAFVVLLDKSVRYPEAARFVTLPNPTIDLVKLMLAEALFGVYVTCVVPLLLLILRAYIL